MQFTFIKPDYSALTNCLGTYEGEFALSLYRYKIMDSRNLSIYKGIAPTEAEFADFVMETSRAEDLLATFTILVEEMTDPLVNTTTRTDANWNSELAVIKTVNALASGEATWAVYGKGDECFMIPVLSTDTDAQTAPVVLDNLTLVSGSPVQLKNFSMFINPFKSGLWGAV